MAVYLPHTRVTVSGVLESQGVGGGTPREIFSWSFGLGPRSSGNDPAMPVDQALEDVRDACAAYFSRNTTGISGGAHALECKFAPIGPDGKYSGAPRILPFTDVYGGGNQGGNHPPQVTYRVSLQEAEGLRPVRGGWFVPYPVFPIETSGYGMSSGNAQGAADSARTFVDDVNSANGSASVTMIIPSIKRGGVNPAVAIVRVGNIFDTQRRRRNDLTESYFVGG